MTKAFNRRHFLEELENNIYDSNRYYLPLSIVMFDIDYFKKVNDVYGHLVGDEVLFKLSAEIMKYKRKTDIFGRYGGEEFILVLARTNTETAVKIAEKMRELVKKLIFSVPELKITISCGVQEYEVDTDSSTFISLVDEKLYKAKENGRDRVEY